MFVGNRRKEGKNKQIFAISVIWGVGGGAK